MMSFKGTPPPLTQQQQQQQEQQQQQQQQEQQQQEEEEEEEEEVEVEAQAAQAAQVKVKDDEALQAVLALPESQAARDLPVMVVRHHLGAERLQALLAAECSELEATAEPILNDPADMRRKGAQDLSRRMHAWPDGSKLLQALEEVVVPVAQQLGAYVASSSALSSLPPPRGAPRRRRQLAHTDYCMEKVKLCAAWPWTLLFALTDFARVFVRTADGKDVVLLLRLGEALLFRGDVLHGGMEYSVLNWRAHFYLEPLGTTGLRMQGKVLALHEVDMSAYKLPDAVDVSLPRVSAKEAAKVLLEMR